MELAACRVPGIFGAAFPFAGVIKSERDGILVDGRTESWTKAIARLIGSPADRRRIAESAAARVLSEHTVERNSSRWRELYDLLIEAARTARANGDSEQQRIGELLAAPTS